MGNVQQEWDAIQAAPVIHITFFLASVAVAWAIVTYLHRAKVARLEQDAKSEQAAAARLRDERDDLIGRLDRANAELARGTLAEGDEFPDEPPPSVDREFLRPEITFQSIAALRAGKTQMQADRATGGYLGKWMRVVAPVADVARRDDHIVVSLDLDKSGMALTEMLALNVALYFDLGLERPLDLDPGSPIAAEGMIAQINSAGITLIYCEMIL